MGVYINLFEGFGVTGSVGIRAVSGTDDRLVFGHNNFRCTGGDKIQDLSIVIRE